MPYLGAKIYDITRLSVGRGMGQVSQGPPGFNSQNARMTKMEENINTLMQSQIAFQTETRQQIGSLTREVSQLSAEMREL